MTVDQWSTLLTWSAGGLMVGAVAALLARTNAKGIVIMGLSAFALVFLLGLWLMTQ